MKNIYKIFSLLILLFIGLDGYGQDGEGTTNIDNYGYLVWKKSWRNKGYYEGYKLNVKDLIGYDRGGSSYMVYYCKYFVDNVLVLDHGERASIPDHYIEITKNFTLKFTHSRIKATGGSKREPDATWDIKVIPWDFYLPLQVCSTDGTLDLKKYLQTSFGTYATGNFPHGNFSGQAVVSGKFNPQTAGIGSHTIVFTYGSKSVTKTIQVVAPTSIENNLPSSIYNTNTVGSVVGRMDLKSYVTPNTGSFRVISFAYSNTGTTIPITDNRYLNLFGVISESEYANRSPKNITVTYTFINDACTQTFAKVVTVVNNNIDVKLDDFKDLCKDGLEHDLTTLGKTFAPSPSGGTFTANGLTLSDENGKYVIADKIPKQGQSEITYTVTKNGYSKSAKKYLRVRELPNVTFKAPDRVCFDNEISLLLNVEPKGVGGTFSGDFVDGNIFKPKQAGIGKHKVTYTFKDGYGCTGSASTVIEVVDLLSKDISFNLPSSVCADAPIMELTQYVSNHTGGTFDGSGVMNNYFNPSLAGGNFNGLTQLKYKIQSGICKKEYISTITVNPRPSLGFNTIQKICNDDAEINLMDYVSPNDVAKSSFSGNGVVGNKFIARNADKGTHVITFHYTDGNGCTNEISQSVVVSGLIPSNLKFDNLPSICINANPINLREYVNSTLGTFSGTGVIGDVFDPSKAGSPGTKITYTYIDGTCPKILDKTIIVLGQTAVTFSPIAPICNKNSIKLMSYVGAHTGGTFSGNGVTDNVFYPEIAGIGTHLITYKYVNNSNCETTVTQSLKVDLLMDGSISFNSIPSKCVNSPSVFLRDYIGTLDGTFSGQGVTGEYFNPSSAGKGNWTVTWREKNGACTIERTTVIKVVSEPLVVFNTLPKVCHQSDVIELDKYVGSFTGGVFSGVGVIDNKFHAEQAGTGYHTINYLFTQGDCQVLKQQIINVGGLLNKEAKFSPLPDVCITGGSVDLLEYVNVGGGVFSGQGVTGNFFNPQAAGPGLKKITYTLTDGTCSDPHTQIIEVHNFTPFTFEDPQFICKSNPIYLNTYVTPFREGGVFAGKGVVENIFYPEVAGVGQHPITFTYVNSYGCETVLVKTIHVDQLLGSVEWKDIENVCKSSSSIYLPDYIEGHSGGVFSGQGVNGEYFNPSNVNAANYTIKYKVTGGRCSEEYSTVIVVSEGVNSKFHTVPPICLAEKIDLNTTKYVSHTGKNATFSGNGIDGNFFDPVVAGRGLHTITYSYKNAQGCESIIHQVINVVDLLGEIAFNDLPSICESTSPIILDSFIEGHSGGSFSGVGVQGNVFNPSMAKKGLHLITYTISNGSCFIELQKNIEVHPQETVTFSKVNDLCFIQNIDLSRYVSPSGGVFSGIGIQGNEFNPSAAGIGSFLIEYAFTSSNGCITVAKQTINVTDLVSMDISFSEFPEVCSNSATLYLPDYVDGHSDGTFSGRGVTGNYFNPEVAGKGSHLINYLILKGNCKIEIQEVVHVFNPDDIVFSTIPNVCYDAPINLFNYVSPIGGLFSGNGVVDGFFHPSNVGLGDYTVSYQYVNGKGCSGTVTKVIKVINLLSSNIVFSSLPEVCPNTSVINLRDYVNTVEGVFYGKGVTEDYFDPSVAGSGVHKIELRIIDGACKTERFQSIIVKKPTPITFSKIPEICNPDLVDLASFIVPKGGQFAGNSVIGNNFNPLLAGIGTHEITYLFNDPTGCTNQVKQIITVGDLIPKSLSFNTLPNICTNSESLRLSDYLSVNVDGGIFSGKGVSGEYLNPSQSGKGVHQITYSIGKGSCKKVLTQTVKISGIDENVQFYTLPDVCENRQIDLTDYISKHVGVFSGIGVINNKFNPSQAGVGTHTISYLFQNELGCEFVISKDIIVRDLMPSNITFSPLPDVCSDYSSVKLSDYTNYSGVFSGNGVNGEYFNPSNVKAGTYTINFTYSNGICQGTKKQTITVKGKEEVFFNDVQPICKNTILELSQYAFPQGGVFSGNGVYQNKFYPSQAGIGKHIVTYKFTNELNCNTVIQKEFEVLELITPNLEFLTLPDICVNSSPLKLSDYLKNSDKKGKFTGNGVEGEYFNPYSVTPGAWTITYEIGNNNKCKETFRQTLVVHSNDSVVFSNIPILCNHAPIDLMDYVSHKTGVFSGNGVHNNIFNPSLAGTGKHLIVYNYKSLIGCESVLTKTIDVPRIYSNISFNPIGEVCQNSGQINLSNYVNVSGGVFSGEGVENNQFNPSLAKGGTHQITYTLGNESCSVSSTEMISVIGLPEIEVSDFPDICFNEVLDLEKYVSHKGTFSGLGVENNSFNPQIAGQGKHKIRFNYVQNNCQVNIDKFINVLSINDVNIEFYAINEMCVNSPSIDLSVYTNTKGNFSGKGVEGNIFNPSIAGAGTHECILKVGQASCQRELRQYITVYNTTLLAASNIDICNGESINLNNYVNIEGGQFKGQGVGANYFYPEKIGDHKVSYNYQNRNGCSSSVEFLVKVNGMHPSTIEFRELPNVCTHDAIIDLREYVNYYTNDSKFSGVGVTGYNFSPNVAKSGVHQITYTNGNGACKSVLNQNIQVSAPTVLTFDMPSLICNETNIDLEKLTNVDYPKFSGSGVSSNMFSSASSGIGKHVITLNYENSSGCVSTIQKSVDVKALNPKSIIFSSLPDVCVNQSRINLTNYTSDSDISIFSGKGVTGKYFFPSQAGVGTHIISYKVGLSSECIDTYSQIITVQALPNVTFRALPEVCFNTAIPLDKYVSLEGGYFSGNGVNDGVFNPELADKGTHIISYNIEDDYGCETVVSQVINVRSLFNPNITFNALPNVCVNSENLNLIEYVSEFIGSFSGSGVVSTIFNAQKAGVGTHEIKYSVGTSSCAVEYTQYITVYPLPNVVFDPLPVICFNTEINLNNYVFLEGGSFSGAGVLNNQINTANLEVGVYTISYTYADRNGCKVVTTQILEVNGKSELDSIIEFTSLPNSCMGSNPLNLRDYVNSSQGTFSGVGVVGSLFNPTSAGIGVHLIKYTFGIGQCKTEIQQEIIVKDAPNVEFYPLPEMCTMVSQIELANYISHAGGIFEGVGVENGFLKRSLLSRGTHVITYKFITDEGCNLEISKSIVIGDIVPDNLVFTSPEEICENGGSINLFALINSINGKFSGVGVDDNGYFSPNVAKQGTHRITYEIGVGNCQTKLVEQVLVTPPKNVEFLSVGKVCTKDLIPLSEYVNYKGGTFSGKGVTDNMFDPISAGEGIHRVSYLYFDALCKIEVSQNIEVLNTKELQVNVDKSSIESSALVKFSSEGFQIQNYRWEFGDGGYSLEKEPFHYYYHTGTFDVTLVCQDQNGCEHTIKKENFLTVLPYSSSLKSVILINDPSAKVGFHNVDEGLYELKINVSPNPFTSFINISNLPKNKVSTIAISNVNGRVLYKGKSSHVTEKTIYLEGLSEGVYFIRVNDKVEKLIKK